MISHLSTVLLLTIGVGTEQPPSGESALSTVHWMENRGQWPPDFEYVGTLGGAAIGVKRGSLIVQPRGPDGSWSGTSVALHFEGSSSDVRVEALDPEPGLHHFYLGNDPDRWVKNVRSFSRVRLAGLYEGIDLVLREERGMLEYDLLLSSGAGLSAVVVRCEGIESLVFDELEGLTIETEHGPLRHPLGRSWQLEEDGTRTELLVRTRRIDDRRFGFECPERDPALTLVIDPGLVWSTLWPGDTTQQGVVDAQGNLTVVGIVDGPFFLQTEPSFQAPGANKDVFVARFRHADGQLVYSSRFGSSSRDEGNSIAVDAAGRSTVVGWAQGLGQDFPTTPGAFDPIKTSGISAFVLRLSPLGDDLEYSTYLEGTSDITMATAVAVTASGSAVVTGNTRSSSYPTTPGAFATVKSYTDDVFVTRLDPTGSSLEWSTFVGGNGGDFGLDIALDPQETVFVAGRLDGGTFPTTPGAFQPSPSPLSNAFVSRLAPDGSDLLWSTHLGGESFDAAFALALVPDGDVIVAGTTNSYQFPTTPGAFRTTKGTGDHMYVTRLDASGSRLVHSTFLGAGYASGVAVDRSGVVAVTGLGGNNFPTTPGAFSTTGGSPPPIVTVLDPGLSRLFYSTYLSPGPGGYSAGLTTGPTGRITALGLAYGPFPTTPDALFPEYNASITCYITTLDPYLSGVRSVGTSAPSCLGPVIANATEMPTSGGSFGLYCSQAPPSARGYLTVQPVGPSGEPLSGGLAWLRPVRSDPDGYLETSLGNLPLSKGLRFRSRFVFLNPPACTTGQLFSWSNTLEIEVQ